LDEALRSGLQSPSVPYPSIRQKLQILPLIDVLGLYSADDVLPGLITVLARASALGKPAPGETLAAIISLLGNSPLGNEAWLVVP
jgi:hypothetical protein